MIIRGLSVTKLKLVFLGPPLAGKGTQAKKIAAHFKIPHLSTGDLFREEINQQTELGLKIKEIIATGKLVDDSITVNVISNHIKAATNGFLLDGFPRTIAQAEALKKIVDISHVIYFNVDREVLIDRVVGRIVCSVCGASYHIRNLPPNMDGICDLCGGNLIKRKDDNEEVLNQRLDAYYASTQVLIDYYRSQGLLLEVDSNKDAHDLFKHLVETLS